MPRLASTFLFVLVVLAGPSAAAERLADVFAAPPTSVAPSGVLLDRVLPLAEVAALDGSADAPVVDRVRWRQAYHELQRAGAKDLPVWTAWWNDATASSRAIPIAVLDRRAERLREGVAPGNGLQRSGDRFDVKASAVTSTRVFTAAALIERTYQGRRVVFDLGSRWRFGDAVGRDFALDAGDGTGWRAVPADGIVRVDYATPGTKTLAVRAEGDGAIARFVFEVVALAVPAPEDSIRVTATVPFEGDVASGDAYVYLAPGHAAIERPLVFVEGLDLDDSLGRDALYALLNTENLLEDLRALGFDVVVLDFDDATTYVQRNGLLVAELVLEMQRRIAPTTRFTLAGASMGGICTRYALAWLEDQGIEHRVDLMVAFDSPHRGANIPLGLQFWVDFFRGESAEAEFLAGRLDRPAARQLLAYHYRAEGTGAFADPLRADLLTDLAALGDYPEQPRLVAVANGSGTGIGQPYGPADQILRWEYSSFVASVTGNVWAVGDGATTTIFEGEIRAFLIPIAGRSIDVTNSEPYDNAPGGTRASQQQAADVEAPYGDIVALHPNHDFIPTVSALDIATAAILDDVSTLPDPAAVSPFDAVYAPAENQEHVLVTPENAAWLRAEVLGVATDAPSVARSGIRLLAARPNPFNPSTTLSFEIERAGHVGLGVFDLRGRRVRTLLDAERGAGRHDVAWNGRDDSGAAVASGVYLVRLDQGPDAVSGRVVLVE